MPLRRQLPVYSPLSAAAVVAGVGALLLGERRSLEEISRQLANRLGARALTFTDSGTSALRLALAVAPGSLVALPAYSCYDIATAAVGAGVRTLLYDLDPRTLGPDFASFNAALAAGARAAVVASLFGLPADMQLARDLCDRHGALLIEDTAQGSGAALGGRSLGTWGSIGVLSFGRGKGVTGGGGGALYATDDAGTLALSTLPGGLPLGGEMGTVVALLAQWLIARPAWYGIPAAMPFLKLGETIYHTPWAPRALSRVSAGTVSITIGLAPGEAKTRREHARRLAIAAAESRSLTAIEPLPGAEPGYLRFPILVSGEKRKIFDASTARNLGIMPGYPRPLETLEVFRDSIANREAGFPGANRLARDLFTLPTHSRLTTGDLENLEALVRAA